MSVSGTKFTQVAYKGAGPAMADTLGGHTKVIMDALSTSLPHIQAGTIRPLGQSGTNRSPLLPELPTIAEAGVAGYEATVYNALLGPAGLPPEIIGKLQAAIAKARESVDVEEKFRRMGITMTGSTPEQLARYIQVETAKWSKIIREVGIVGQ